MSNQNKPKLGMPSKDLPPPPPVASDADKIREKYAELLEKYPPPWVVGPHGDVWVAADVETFDPDKEGGIEKVPGPNGTWWRATCAKPRLVFEPTDNGIAALTVDAVNALLG